MNHRRTTLTCALLLAGAIAAAPAAADEPDRFVLVWQDAWLYTAPDLDADRARVFGWEPSERLDHPGQLVSMRLVAEHEGFVEVATTVGDPPGHCYPTLGDVWPFEVHLFVQRADLAHVTTGRLHVPFEDGTGVTLQPGVALLPTGGDGRMRQFRVGVDGLAFTVSMPAAGIGQEYAPGPLPEGGGWLGVQLDPEAEMRLGDGSRVERYHEFAPARPSVQASHERGALLTMRSSCVEARVAVAEDALKDVVSSEGLLALIGTMGEGGMGEHEVHVLPPGSAVYFIDGRQAGRSYHEYVVYEGEFETTGDGALWCRERLIGYADELLAPGSERSLRLCVRPDDLRVESRGGPMISGSVSLDDLLETPESE